MPVKQMILVILMLQGANPVIYAQHSNSLSVHIGVPFSTALILGHNEDVQAGVYGTGLGVYVSRMYARKMFIFCGIGADYQKINNYRNHVTYTSNWVNGIEQTRVKLNTNIDQFFVKVPIILGHQFSQSFYAGAGVEFASLISSTINQHAMGNYVEENYPDDGEILTATIKYEYKIDSERNNAPFPRFNVAPCIAVGYENKSFRIQYMLSYDLLSSPVVERRFNQYNLLRNQIALTFKLKSYEKFN